MTISFLFKARLVCLLSSYRVAFIILNSNKTIATNNPDWVVQELNSQLKTWITKLTTLVQDIETARRQKSKQNSKTKRNIFQRYFSLENKPSSGAKRKRKMRVVISYIIKLRRVDSFLEETIFSLCLSSKLTKSRLLLMSQSSGERDENGWLNVQVDWKAMRREWNRWVASHGDQLYIHCT